MKQIKIQKKFWDKMVSGEKQYEFRKLEKGLISGTYEFVSSDHNKQYLYFGEHIKPIIIHKVFGTAHLTAIGANCPVYKSEYHTNTYYVDIQIDIVEIDKETYHFVKENYIDKGIDFMVYEISDVKENK